jgi:hypothetical protein
MEHCRQIVGAYTARGRRAGYVHSREDGAANQRVMQQLKDHELDVIVQVRKLGEGFDHIYLSVAAVFSIFSNLSPFVQFVGRIMRVIEQTSPGHVKNQGVVVFHAGANIARRWSDFQEYSEADQLFFDALLPVEGFDPADPEGERQIEPMPRPENEVDVRAQSGVQLEEIPLLEADEAAAIQLLQERGIIEGTFDPARQALQPVPTTRVAERQAMRSGLDMRVRTEAARILNQRGINCAGHELDRKHLGRDNMVVLKTAIDRQVNNAARRQGGQRHEFTRAELDQIDAGFADMVAAAVREVFDGD